MAQLEQTDFIVIGGGIAGASIAARLAEDAEVILLEAESRPGYHSTGRSAAYFAPAYGNAVVRNLTAPGDRFFHEPPAGFSEAPLIRDRAALFVARDDQQASVDDMLKENPDLRQLAGSELNGRVPILRPDEITMGLLDVRGGDLDVDAILQGYLRQFRKAGGRIFTGTRVQSIAAGNDLQRWKVNEAFSAPVIINAAGAWADVVATAAGLAPLGLQPMRRTAFLVDAPDSAGTDIDSWPLTVGIDEDFYFKPDAGHLLISPADETPSVPCDAQPEEIDIAIAIDRVQRVTHLDVSHVRHRWAGLRTFAPDKSFVIGFDPRAAGFFWLAGQGGYGVQSAPGVSALAQHLLTGATPADGFQDVTLSIDAVCPARLIQ